MKNKTVKFLLMSKLSEFINIKYIVDNLLMIMGLSIHTIS